MLIIGICGASGSGKSTLAENIRGRLNGKAMIIPMDCYYNDHPELCFEERALLDYDQPSSFAMDEFYEDLLKLKRGERITTKQYDFDRHRRNDSDELIEPPEVLIIEGIHTFADPRVLDIMDIKFYVDVDSDVCLTRRIKRDVRERGREALDVCRQYIATVKPAFDSIISKYREACDVCVVRGGKNDVAAEMAAAFIEKRLAGK